MDQPITRATGATPSTTPPAAARRSWSILLTSANHGVVGPLGHIFKHAGEHHERVQVVEIVEAGAPPAPDADLAGLVRLPLTNEKIDAAWDSLPSKFWRGQSEYEWNCEKRRTFARAIEREVAAQAGQVAPAEPLAMVSPRELRDIQAGRGGVPVRGNQWRDDQTVPIYAAPVAGQVAVPEGWTVERVGEAIHIKRADGRWCGYMQEIDSPAHRLTHEFLSAMLAAAPAAPSPAKESK